MRWSYFFLFCFLLNAKAQTPDVRKLGAAGATQTYYCRVLDVSTSFGFEGTPLEIQRNSVVFTQDGVTWPSLSLLNKAPLSVQAAAFVVEYASQDGQIVDRVPIVIATQATRNTFRVPFHLPRTFTWVSALNPGEVAIVNAAGDGTRTGICPSAGSFTQP